MKNDATLANLLKNANIHAAVKRIENSPTDFSTLVEILGLDRSRDFRFSNLRDVDFSYSDLRGFDFRGADLRYSYGVSVQFDKTTNFDMADVQASCFAMYMREQALFRDNPKATAMYEALFSGNPMEVSAWLHARYMNEPEKHSILKNADKITASILCQKLMADDIDLTKRTDLFHFIGPITQNRDERRELLLGVIARYRENTVVIEKFIKVVGRLYGNDPVIFNALMLLCNAREQRIREAAFLATFNTKLVVNHLQKLIDLFMSEENADIRKGFLLRTANSHGRMHVRAINLDASMIDISISEVLDVPELLDEQNAKVIAAITRKQKWDAEARSDYEKLHLWEDGKPLSVVEVSSIIELQEEVLCTSPVISTIFAYQHKSRAEMALQRINTRNGQKRHAMAESIMRKYSRS